MTLDKLAIAVALARLARSQHQRAADLYSRLMGSWGHRPDRQRVTLKLAEPDMHLLHSLGLTNVLRRDVLTSGYLVVYRHPRRKELEVRVRIKKKPPKRKTFTIGGSRRRLVAVSIEKFITTKEAVPMATRTRKAKKAVEDDELDELEGLEDLDELEDEELEDEEPEDEDEDEDEEDEEPAPKRSRAKAKAKAPAKKAATKSRRKAAPVEEEEEDDDEEDEAPARKRTAKKAPAKKASTKSNGGSKGNLPATRELPKGKLGPQDIAEMVGGGCDARYVRIFLRDSDDYEREEGSRWAFGKQEARTLVKEIKAARKNAGAS